MEEKCDILEDRVEIYLVYLIDTLVRDLPTQTSMEHGPKSMLLSSKSVELGAQNDGAPHPPFTFTASSAPVEAPVEAPPPISACGRRPVARPVQRKAGATGGGAEWWRQQQALQQQRSVWTLCRFGLRTRHREARWCCGAHRKCLLPLWSRLWT